MKLFTVLREMMTEARSAGPLHPNAWQERRPEPAAAVWRSFGFKVGWQGSTKLRWKKCTCSGGVQVLLGDLDGWGKIPAGMTTYGGDEAGSPLANIRTCPSCHGTGHHWVAEEA